MEDAYYRPPRERSLLKRVLSRARKNKRWTMLLGLGLLLVFWVLLHNKGVIARVRLEQEKRQMELKIQLAQEENARLQGQIKALEGDKKTVEKIAREKYGMAREGETVYRVKKE